LDRLVRLLSTEVWPTLYQVLTCLTSEPLRVWCLPKEQAIKLLPPGQSPRTEIESFYAAVLERTKERSPERSLQVIRKGLVFLAASRAWYASGPPAEPGSPSVRQAGSESRTQARERGLLLLGCVVFSVLVAVIVLIGIITALHPHLF
jgi:hypothetical protein